MITIARIINAFRDAEQFELPLDPRSFLWHMLIIPQYTFAIFSFWTYSLLSRQSGLSKVERMQLTFLLLIMDVGLSWAAFELFLKYFREQY